jgi:Ca2+/Na+ antiporter
MEQPKSRNAAKKKFTIALVVITFLIAAIIITKFYLKAIGVLMFVAVLIYGALSFAKLSKEEKKTSLETAGSSDKMPLGKAVQFLQYLIYALIAVAIIRLLIGQPK